MLAMTYFLTKYTITMSALCLSYPTHPSKFWMCLLTFAFITLAQMHDDARGFSTNWYLNIVFSFVLGIVAVLR